MPVPSAPQDTCPNCHATRVLRTSRTSGKEFFCPHCDYIWSADASSAPRVLVVDDEDMILNLVDRTLQSAGYEVVTVSDAREGLDVAEHEQRRFDLFLFDVRMPGMTGDQLAQHVRRTYPDCKVLYFTGYAEQLFNARRTLWENEAFIEKPASPTALLEAVSLLLYGHTHGPR